MNQANLLEEEALAEACPVAAEPLEVTDRNEEILMVVGDEGLGIHRTAVHTEGPRQIRPSNEPMLLHSHPIHNLDHAHHLPFPASTRISKRSCPLNQPRSPP